MKIEKFMIDSRELIIIIGKGNIGCINVLVEIAKSDSVFLNPLAIAMELTNSKSCAIWEIYKDICHCDIQKTKKVLKNWFNYSTDPLEVWLKYNKNNYVK